MKTLSVSNKVGYGLGDFGNNMSFAMSSVFLLAYYTDVLGISAAAAGTLFLVARIWDAINDPMMGTLCDKLFSKRTGDKFRPYLLKGSWPILLASILMFWSPEGLTDMQKLTWAYITYIFWGMSYTFINIPYGSLASVMTNEPGERAALSGARSMGGLFGGVLCNLLMPLLLSFYADDLSKAYLYGIIGFSLVAFVCYIAAYRLTAEHIKHEVTTTEPVKFSETLKTLTKNKPFICVSVASLFMLTAFITQGSMLYYYLSENLGGAVWIISVTAVLQVITILAIAPFIGKLTARFGVKNLMMVGFFGAAVVSAGVFMLPTSVYTTLSFYVLGMPFLLLASILIWANVADCIDHNYEISGVRSEGIIYSSYSFMRKMGQAIAGFLSGMGLSAVGYSATVELQSDITLMGIKAMMFLLPAVCLFFSAVLYKFMWTLDPVANAAQEKKLKAKNAIA